MDIRNIVIDALQAAYDTHERLGKAGEELVQKNQFGDGALRADIECEQAVLGVLRRNNMPIKVVSEEYGETLIGEEPRYLGVLDGIDGTAVYKKARGEGRYGTMFAIFKGTNPRYCDYIAAGIMQHATGRLFIAEKGKGAFIIQAGDERTIAVSGKQRLDTTSTLYVDESFEYNQKTFSIPLRDFKPKYEGASSLYYAALAEGVADVVMECTRKSNLEIAVEYGITKEAGGCVVDIAGRDIGEYRYLEFGQTNEVSVISAASKELAREIIKKVKR